MTGDSLILTNATGERAASCAAGAATSHNLVCFGHPLLDMIAPVDLSVLEDFGIAAGSVNMAQPHQMPLYQRLTQEAGIEYVPGGSAMNTARVVAWMRPGVTVSYVGALGVDDFGTILKNSLRKEGVQSLFEEHADKPTGTCAVLLTNKQRSLLPNLGAAVTLSLDHIFSEPVQSAIRGAGAYYSEGFFLNTASSPDNLLCAALHASRNRKLFCFNLNAPYISHAFPERLRVLLPLVSILFGNDEDVLAFAKRAWPEDFRDPEIDVPTPTGLLSPCRRRHLEVAIRRMAQLPCATYDLQRLIVVTCGRDAALVCDGVGITSHPAPPMDSSEIVDANGAGDAFVGGFLSQYLLTRSPEQSVLVGHLAAQDCLRHNGATHGDVPPALTHPRVNL